MNHLNRIALKNASTDYDFNVYSMGREDTAPGKIIGPCVRSKYVIHYVLKGSGTFNGIPISRGNGFLICPNEPHHYISDKDSPLSYGWISFFGYGTEKLLQKAGFELKNQVFNCDWIESLDILFDKLCNNQFPDADTAEYLIGCFHMMMSFHIKNHNAKNTTMYHQSAAKEHVGCAVKFINDNYYRNITVADVAAACCISAHYLSNIFKNEIGFPPQKYLLNIRMEQASELLYMDNLSITDIANSVGYSDVLAFSKMFHKHFGESPSSYRAKLL